MNRLDEMMASDSRSPRGLLSQRVVDCSRLGNEPKPSPYCRRNNNAFKTPSRRTISGSSSFGTPTNGAIIISVIVLSVAIMIDLSSGATSSLNSSQQQPQNFSSANKVGKQSPSNIEITPKRANLAKQQPALASNSSTVLNSLNKNNVTSTNSNTPATVSSTTTSTLSSNLTSPTSTGSSPIPLKKSDVVNQSNGDLSASPSSISTMSTARVVSPTATTESQQQQLASTPANKLSSTTAASTSPADQFVSGDWSPRNEPFPSRQSADKSKTSLTSNVTNKSSKSNRQQQQQQQQDSARSQNDQQSQPTSHSVSFADPTTAASTTSLSSQQSVIKQHQSAKGSSNASNNNNGGGGGGNRWTHFGARLRPLAPVGNTIDHHEAATSNSKSTRLAVGGGSSTRSQPIVVIGQSGSGSNNLLQRQPHASAIFVSPINGNSLAPTAADSHANGQAAAAAANAGNDDDDDDDLDSEALLYKMMQQQNFLMNPNWQQLNDNERRTKSNPVNVNANSINGGNNIQNQQQQQQQQQHGARPDELNNLSNSKKVIKLLKSYSHIHQVDDSDDQIRGTYTRLSANRPAATITSQQGSQNYNDYANGSQNRRQTGQSGNRQRQQHIFVSSRPVNPTGPGSQTAASRAINSPLGRQQQAQQFGNQLDGNNYNNDDDGAGDQNVVNNVADSSAPSSARPSNQAPPGEEEEEFECPNNGIFADVASGCQSYHVCQSGAQVQEKFQCPLGTLFNNIILTCDFAHNVQCNGGQQQGARSTQSDEINQLNRHQSSASQDGRVAQVNTKPAQQQQTPRASTQVSQGSLVRQLQHQQQQQQTGPRHLVIGSQYNRHNQGQQTRGPVVGTYPPRVLDSTGNPKKLNGEDEEEDDDPIEPLIAATLPPSQPKHQAPAPSAHRAIYPNNEPPARQSAHLSQYPRQNSDLRQRQTELSNNYDSASSARPLFASRDEAPTTLAPKDYGTHLGQPTPSAQQPDPQAQAFNLVINHVTPVNNQHHHHQQQQQHHHQQQHQIASPTAATTPAVTTLAQQPPVYKSQFKADKQPQQHRYKETGYQSSNHVNSVQNLQRNAANQQQQLHQRSIQSPRQINYSNTRAAQTQNVLVNNQQQQQISRQQQRANPVATNQQQSFTTPINGLIDLTNDKKSAGISSEALNDGLLLIVRHSANSNPIGLSGGVGGNKQHSSNQNNLLSQQGSGQAFAVDPTIVSHSSPVDAQLFPNVQRTIANLHQQHQQQLGSSSQASTNLIKHQSPPSGQQQQPPRQYNSNNINHQGANVNGPLPPMEPPKPQQSHTISDLSAIEQNNPVQNEQFLAASTSTATNLAPSVAQQQQTSASSFKLTNSANKNNNPEKPSKRTIQVSAQPQQQQQQKQQQQPTKIIRRAKKLMAAKIVQKPTGTNKPSSSSGNGSSNNSGTNEGAQSN